MASSGRNGLWPSSRCVLLINAFAHLRPDREHIAPPLYVGLRSHEWQTPGPLRVASDKRLPGESPGPGILQLNRHLRTHCRVPAPGQGRGHPPRRRPRPSAHHHRRRRRLDLETRCRRVPRGHLHRGPLPRPRAPAQAGPARTQRRSWPPTNLTYTPPRLRNGPLTPAHPRT